MNFRRISEAQNEIARRVFREGRTLGVTAVSTSCARRVHCGYGEDAWSSPVLTVFGNAPRPEVMALADGWRGEVKFVV